MPRHQLDFPDGTYIRTGFYIDWDGDTPSVVESVVGEFDSELEAVEAITKVECAELKRLSDEFTCVLNRVTKLQALEFKYRMQAIDSE